MSHIVCPPPIYVGESAQKELDEALVQGRALRWLVQVDADCRPLGECTVDKLRRAKLAMANPWTTFKFADWQNRTVDKFLRSGATETFEQWLAGREAK